MLDFLQFIRKLLECQGGSTVVSVSCSSSTTYQPRTRLGLDHVVVYVDDDEMKSNLQVMQATYEKLLNGFMEASQDRFSKLEKAVNRIVDKLLSGNIRSSRDSLNFGSARAILRSGRIVNNGRNKVVIVLYFNLGLGCCVVMAMVLRFRVMVGFDLGNEDGVSGFGFVWAVEMVFLDSLGWQQWHF
ncbi:hypothetical protein LWI28_018082 [Acer negundo]|uniref:Uncharacterized protein n=1 Tax=Acer negundo TaxID=4023 RepID=A0AAD5JDV1_ACENE|nr:hypothetical protein LWI28_018082 [Acer negundo]